MANAECQRTQEREGRHTATIVRWNTVENFRTALPLRNNGDIIVLYYHAILYTVNSFSGLSAGAGLRAHLYRPAQFPCPHHITNSLSQAISLCSPPPTHTYLSLHSGPSPHPRHLLILLVCHELLLCRIAGLHFTPVWGDLLDCGHFLPCTLQFVAFCFVTDPCAKRVH